MSSRVAAAWWPVLALGVMVGCSTTSGAAGPTTPASSAAPSATSTPSVTANPPATLNPDTAFGSTVPVWREHTGPGEGPFANEDTSLTAGSYRLNVICTGGVLSLTANGVALGSVDCATQSTGFPVCLRSTGLKVTATWTRQPHGDLVWQVSRQPGSCG